MFKLIQISRIILPGLFLLLIYHSSYSQDWNFAKEKDGIKIYTREETGSNIRSFRGETVYHTSMDRMKKLIGRIDSFEWWDEDITEIKVLAYEEEKFIRYYLVYDVPWPLTDRDLCAEATITNDPVTGRRVVRARAIPGLVDEKPDKVRISYFWQQWIMEPGPDGTVNAILEGSVDPAGAIPAWIVNMVITDTPLNVMTKARLEVED